MKNLFKNRYWLHTLVGIILGFFMETPIKIMGSLRDLETLLVMGLVLTWVGFLFEWIQASFSGKGAAKFPFNILDKIKLIPQNFKVEKDNWDAILVGIGGIVGALISITLV